MYLADFINLDDVGVLQAGDHLGLAAEAAALLLGGIGVGEEHLQRHHPIEADLPGQVDHPHAAPAQLADDLVAGNGRKPIGRRGRGGTVRDRRR